ncbi:MAG: hypothetical protein GOU98_00430 [Candidatus Altiarchaeota archaeon]|nr:hypothetical protein [Candidatus Altiarchaeota archaeon]
MRWVLLFLVLGMTYTGAYAQGSYEEDDTINLELGGLDLSEMLTSLTNSLKNVNLIPDLSSSCKEHEACGSDECPPKVCEINSQCSSDSTCVGNSCLISDCNPLSQDKTRAYFMILLLLFMAFSIVIGLSNMPSSIFSFFITSFLFNNIPSLFEVAAAQGLFEYVFSALFIFLWTDYILQYMWAISPMTRLFLEASVTLIALFFMSIGAVYERIAWMLEFFLGTVGFIMFMFFMLGMHFFNAFISLTNVKAARNLRKGGSVAVQNVDKDVERKVIAEGGDR